MDSVFLVSEAVVIGVLVYVLARVLWWLLGGK